MNSRVLWVSGFVLWGAALAFGFHKAMGWEFRPGQDGVAPTRQTKPADRPRLVVVLHSQCPCSLATLQNLATLTADERARVSIRFVFTGPDIQHSPAYAKAASLPEAEKEICSETDAIHRYGARTSGQAFLYDSNGTLVFSGGLTEARGVPGEAAGMKAILDTLDGRKCVPFTPVFGCQLETPHSQ